MNSLLVGTSAGELIHLSSDQTKRLQDESLRLPPGHGPRDLSWLLTNGDVLPRFFVSVVAPNGRLWVRAWGAQKGVPDGLYALRAGDTADRVCEVDLQTGAIGFVALSSTMVELVDDPDEAYAFALAALTEAQSLQQTAPSGKII
ncbi:MAG TPA: hypothetical protein VKQ34_04320 [Candidatus Saccharimonadales bacterium]|nr:hypothetical protein [Candidatus Saccharimonadales bacterium]